MSITISGSRGADTFSPSDETDFTQLKALKARYANSSNFRQKILNSTPYQ
jgi:hypothetical protein